MRQIALILPYGEDEPYWDYSDVDTFPPHVLINADESAASIEDLVDLCDRDAENANYHDFCGVHKKLAAILKRQYGDDAKKAMLEITKQGGLHGIRESC